MYFIGIYHHVQMSLGVFQKILLENHELLDESWKLELYYLTKILMRVEIFCSFSYHAFSPFLSNRELHGQLLVVFISYK